MDVTLIHNPVAGDPTQPTGDELRRLIREAGHEVAYITCADPAWAEALVAPGDLVAVAGGDGTTGRIAKRMIGRDIPLTFLPLGTANNIGKTLGLLEQPLAQLIDGWARTPVSRFDVGVVEDPAGQRYFIEAIGMGLFTRTMMDIDDRDALSHLDAAEDKVAHALHLMGERLRAFPARRLDLALDGRDLSGEYLMLEVMNICFVGPNLYVAPQSDPADGLLDVVLIKESEREHLRHYLMTWQRGHLLPPSFTTHRGQHLRLDWHGGALHVDDEAWTPPPVPQSGAAQQPQATAPIPIDIRARPAALSVLIPGAPPSAA